MNNIPTGNVTFLFTDIEGSTKLAQEFHELLPAALEKHHQILNESVEFNNGIVFKTVGDAFCCAFQNPEEAIKAAVDAQIKLNSEEWNKAVIKVRMGIHSGNAEWRDTDYMGYITLARASRVMSVAYGSQILISENTYENVNKIIYNTFQQIRNNINKSEITFRDLGERRLKDLIQPMKLYQLVSSDIPSEFPLLKTLDARPNNLPIQLTSFIGRGKEMPEIKEILVNSRLVTLLGTGGAGKSRLAMQIGAEVIDNFSNGVFIAELAPLSDPDLILQTILHSLGVKEESGMSIELTLTDYLRDKELLLIIDNCEHLIHNCSILAEMLLSVCRNLKIIATSREALNCLGENTYRVPSLSLPDISLNITPDQITQYEAVQLFIERALSVNPNFRVNNENVSELAKICSHLDGIPLAIELAAVRIKILNLNSILERLSKRFKLLTGGKRTALPRQQTLKALIDWSYDLLSQKEKTLWSRLSVFSGGWTIEAAEEICSDDSISKKEILDLLSSLSEKSVIIYDLKNERYKILETIKQYGEDKLCEANETEKIFSKYLDFFTGFSEKAEPGLNGSEILNWLEKSEADNSNFESAIEWSVSSGEISKGIRLAGALGNFWKIKGYYSTGIQLLEKILENAKAESRSDLGKVLNWTGILSRIQGEYEKAQKYNEKGLEICSETGDKTGIAISLNSMGNVATDLRKYKEAQKYFEASLELYRETGNKSGIAISLNNLGNVEIFQGNYEQAQKYYEESLSIQRETGAKRSIAESLNNLGNVKWALEYYEQSNKYYEESLMLFREMGNKSGIADALTNLGNVAFARGDLDKATKFYEEGLSLQREIGEKRGIAYSLNSLGKVATDMRNYESAGKYLKESLILFEGIGDKKLTIESLNCLGILALNQEDFEKAQKYLESSIGLFKETGDIPGISNSLIGFAGILSAGNLASQAAKLLGAVDSALKSINLVLKRDELNNYEKIKNSILKQLSEESYSEHFEEGKKLTPEEAAQFAVKQLGS